MSSEAARNLGAAPGEALPEHESEEPIEGRDSGVHRRMDPEAAHEPEGLFLKYKADRRPVAIVALSFGARLVTYLFATPWIAAAVVPLLMVPSVMTAAYNHHHQHVNTFRSSVLNRLYDLVFALQTGIGPFGWVLHHNLGHHKNYLVQPPHENHDESHWARHKDGSTMGRIEYTLHTYLWHQVEILRVGKKNPEVLRAYLLMKIPHYTLVVLGLWWNPVNFIIAFMIPGALTLIHTCWATYEHHSGQSTEDHYEASTNRIHPWFNILTCNLGLHTAHHMNPGVHWSKLPEVHDRIKARIPERLLWRQFW